MTTPLTARGVAKTLAFLPETTFGVLGTGSAQVLRRSQSMMNLQVQEIDSAEILPSQQMRDARQGTRLVSGQLQAQLSALTYEAIFANLFRSSFVSGVSLTAQSVNLTINGTTGNISLGAISPGNPLTTGIKVGDQIALSGYTGANAINNTVNLCVTTVFAAQIQCAPDPALVAAGTQTGIGIKVIGKKLLMPLTLAASTIGSLSFEHWYSDVGVSELALGCRITSIGISVPPSGIVTMNVGFTGQSLTTYGTQQLAAPLAPTTTNLLTAVTGELLLFGAPIAYITGFNLQISTQADSPPVVGTPYTPNIFLGNLTANGSMTALFASDGITAAFLNEQEFQIELLLTDSNANNPNFINIFLPRVKIFSDNKNDGTMEITRSLNFRCLEQDILGGTGLAYDDTSVMIQDSLAA